MFESFDQEALQKIGAEFERHRLRLGLKRWHVARALGQPDVEAGCRWVMAMEDGSGLCDASDTATELAKLLGVNLPDTLAQVRAQQDARFRARREVQPLWVGSLLRHARLAKTLRVEDVLERAQLDVTPRNIQRLTRYESGELRFPPHPTRQALAGALEISPELLHAAVNREWAFYDAQPRAPRLLVRLMPAVCNQLDYPGELGAREIFEFARQFSAKHDMRTCMRFSQPGDRLLFIRPDGSYTEFFAASATQLKTGVY